MRSGAVGLVAATLALLPGVGAAPMAHAAAEPTSVMIEGAPTSAEDAQPVRLDADLYLPASTPAPAILLAHGFGGSKQSLSDEALWWSDQGYVVLAYTARGFGQSTGDISMNAPQFEVADASRLLDYLSTLPEVASDRPGDPRAAVAGGSYGGALALLLAGYDGRVDAVYSDITWSDLEASLIPQSAVDVDPPGVYKSLWTSFFFASGLGIVPGQPVTECGRFSPQWCELYRQVATTGTVSPEGSVLLAASSPASVADRITAPVLLAGGESDSLFPLSQTDANAALITGAPLKVVWHAGGHDGGVDEGDRLRELAAAWFDAYLRGGPPVQADFEVSLPVGSAINSRDAGSVEVLTAASYPGAFGDLQTQVPITGPPQQILAPPGGEPAAITAVPGAGGLAALAADRLSVPVPGQTAAWVSDPLAVQQRIVGASRVSITMSADRPVTDAVLFVSLRTIGADGRQSLPNGLVAPVRIPQLNAEPITVDVILPAIATEVAAGERLAVVVTTTDFGYRNATAPAVYTVQAGDSVLVPGVSGTLGSAGIPAWIWPAGSIAVVALILLMLALLRPRHGRTSSSA